MSVSRLSRRLGTGDAVFIGLGSMIGAGVFSALGPAAAAAGRGVLVGLLIAAAVAYCNATASAQLAAQYPISGGTYVYGRERLGEWWGFAAGWSFIIGKTASCAAMALTFGSYVAPQHDSLGRLLALAAVGILTWVAARGITRTAALTRAFVSVTLVVLAITVVVLMTGGGGAGLEAVDFTSGSSAYGVLQASGLMFFAFAGYARIATMGEEVLDPARTIPLAITVALGITVLIYLTVAAAALTAVGPNVLAHSPAPLAAAATRSGAAWLVPVLSAGAAVASLGALLALLTGIGRTSLAMGRNGDLPTPFARVHSRHGVPRYAQALVAVVVSLLVLLTDLRGVIGFSSFGVLVYYGIANVSAFTQDQQHRRWPRALNMLVSRVVSDFTVRVWENGVCLLLPRWCCVLVMNPR